MIDVSRPPMSAAMNPHSAFAARAGNEIFGVVSFGPDGSIVGSVLSAGVGVTSVI